MSIYRNGKTWQGFCKDHHWNDRDDSCTGPIQETPVEKASLQTNVINKKTAALKPFFPEKPFLMNLGGLKLYPGIKITLELELPPVLHLVAEKGGREPDIIFNFVPFVLKETWYGKNPMEGKICFSVPINTVAPCSLAVHCSMTIYNKAKRLLELDKIPLYASGLSVYEKGGKLISDAPVIDALGNDFRMSIETAGKEQCTLLSYGNKNDPGLIRQGTRIIKNIAGF